MPRRSSGSSATSSLIKSSLGFTRSTRSASYNESSNEVPPSNQSVSANSSTSTTNPTTSSNSNENANTVLDIEENSSTSRERNSIEPEEDPDADSANLLERIKKRTISGVLKSEADIEFQCPICYDLIEAANMTKCGHSFCRSCIQEALERSRRCPKCNTPCSINKDVFPNFTLNQIIERFREETKKKKCKLSQKKTIISSSIIDLVNSSQNELKLDDVNHLIEILSQRKDELKTENKKVNELVLYDFFKHFEQLKSEELNKIQYEHQVISEDCKKVEENLNVLQAKPILMIANLDKSQPEKLAINDNESGEQLVSSNDSQTSDSMPKSTSTLTELSSKDMQTNETQSSSIDIVELSPNSKNLQLILANKKIIVHRHFDELTQIYVQSHDKDLKDFNVKNSSTESVVDKMRRTVNTLTKYRDIQCIASVNYNSDFSSTSNIVSSVDFNKTYEHFAVAGVTKRIKVFDFLSILDRPIRIHYPILEMNHNAKLSCLNWNRYFGNQLACSDYDGVVTLWDADVGTLTKSLQEHEKRCWSVQFCDVDPRLLASASDDSKVKIWSTNNQYSLLSIDAKSNVCCAVFKPDSKFHVLLGTADHSIHYYDLRNTKEAVSLFTGHTKAVSYVKFLNSHEFVSASTDSFLKMWRLDEGRCVKSYASHINEKNFVGLETHDGYILTGSENNTVYLYSNHVSKPLMSYDFSENDTRKHDDFISAVCWSDQNYVLAANSQGIIKVLELEEYSQ